MTHGPEPSRRGAVVLRWINHNGFRMRTQCNRQEVPSIWEMYDEEHMRQYNSIHNEWDICTDLFLEDNFDLFEPMETASPVLPPYLPLSPQPPAQVGIRLLSRLCV